jgi:hypothetical protein
MMAEIRELDTTGLGEPVALDETVDMKYIVDA